MANIQKVRDCSCGKQYVYGRLNIVDSQIILFDELTGEMVYCCCQCWNDNIAKNGPDAVPAGLSFSKPKLKTVEASCPACSGKRAMETTTVGVKRCLKCGALFGQCYKGESYGVVKPFWSELPENKNALRYFDFVTLGSAGIERRHGWFDIRNNKLVQVG